VRNLRRFVIRTLQLPFERDHHLLVAMLLRGQREDSACPLGDQTLEHRGFSDEGDKRVALAVDSGAQFLDLALRFEDAPCGVRVSTRDTMAPPEDVARAGHDRRTGDSAGFCGALVGIGNPGAVDRSPDGICERPVDANDRRQGDHSVRHSPVAADGGEV
jgi:hypothetical protein